MRIIRGQRGQGRFFAWLSSTAIFLISILTYSGYAAPAPIRWAGQNAEIALGEVTKRTIRIELSPLDDQGHPRLPLPSAALVSFPTIEKLRLRELPDERTVRAGEMLVSIKPDPVTVTFRSAEGKIVQEIIFEDTINGAIGFRTDGAVLGLGEGANQFDRRGTNYAMLNGQRAPFLMTHGGTIPVPFLIGTDGWAIFLHRPWGEFDLRGGRGRFLPRKESQGMEPLELYFIRVQEPADALAECIHLTGQPVMPPKWALGYFQSHRTLAGPEEVLKIAQTFREKQLPCDALIYLGTGYCPAGWNTGHGSLEFNPKTFDHPPDNIRALHDLNFKIILHVNHAPRDLFGASVSEPSDSPIHIHNYWARHHEDFMLGIDGWWPDDGDELPIEARITRHLCYYEGQLQDRPNTRPWSLHRNGYAGVARYGGWIWSGDVQSRWATLAAHVSVGLNHSLSLTPFWGTDTGGFIPTKELTGELYTRWFQFSTFTPLFRSHGRTWKLRLPWGWNTGETGPVEERVVPDSSELHNAEVEPICRKFLELRYRLLPYNYTLMREACDTGLPPMRVLWLHYPRDAEAVKLGDEYLWGHDLLVAPVVEKGAKTRRVYLPDGEWYDWWTSEKMAGHRWIERVVDLGMMPLYARVGTILPLDPVRQFTAQPVTEPTTLRVFPGANGSFTLYDDDGQTLGYRDSTDPKAVWISFRWDDATHRLTVEPDPRMRKWPGGVRVFRVELIGSKMNSKQVEFSGQRVETILR